ncbi:NAD(P)H-hydrate epimerase [Lignipirellula cremea]|uniref:NAD(P)H-hydrate epimerase n=1 Tax=Lignipirellula cremea TaxID=2528010 RepID=A0A518E2G2_9BACT|nr:NAD(P)H-hydrate epimerase [Lignipirellula cremea]QDU98254.1 Bifunctional NAD(P)H-hydrate repair enzyme Nnr [Lignipirellula cremea]
MEPPVLPRGLIREVDRRAIEEYGIPGLVLMENAARGAADLLLGLGVQGPVAVCCGKGNNGGDGFALARWLDLLGVETRTLVWADEDQLQGDAATNYRLLQQAGLPIEHFRGAYDGEQLSRSLFGVDWIVDALLGTGAEGNPRPPLDAVLRRLNQQPCRRLAIDLPSGLDCETGEPGEPTFRADHTCTFVARKPGFCAPAAAPYLGEIHIRQIGAPRKLILEIAAQNAGQ